MANIYQSMRIANDECYTTRAEADKLVNYLVENKLIALSARIWLPFDNYLSRIFQALKDKGFHNLILSNLGEGQDFYYYEPEQWDLIITNPPFSGRTRLMNRLFQFDKPFIILQGSQYFNNQYAVNYLSDKKDITLLLPRTRMSFMTYDAKQDLVVSTKSGVAFYSFWLCYQIKLGGVFISLPDNGREKEIEKMDTIGNPIEDNHLNLFNYERH